ncbi:MAG: hypothetical protein KAR20_24995 [Candidatus Heimdallarchaeota archaeon]|nr:hypothetical protein [Candidatus Heimdallarchaeota archaeon]
MEFKRDSDLYAFAKNYIIAEILFFLGTGILIVFKMMFDLDIHSLLKGTFLGTQSNGLFAAAGSPEQVDWIMTNILGWPVSAFLALFSSLLLIAGFAALAILIPLQIDVFTGTNAISAEALPVGLMFLICWGFFPMLYITRSTYIGWAKSFTRIFTGSPSE